MGLHVAFEQKRKPLTSTLARYHAGKLAARSLPSRNAPPEAQPARLDYARCRRYAYGDEALAAAGLSSVDDLVETVNRLRAERGRRCIPQGDFPSAKKAFERLLAEFMLLRSGE